jgi:hypothetical protein
MKLFLILTITTLLTSCGQTEIQDKETTKEDNISTTISSDTNRLGKLINIRRYRPTHVKFKYVFVDNSGQDQRLSVPGPSDSHLEAVLYFDTTTFHRLLNDNMLLSTISTNHKTEYQFDWLDNDVKNEIEKMDSNTNDFPPTFFMGEQLIDGGYLMLDQKISLQLHTN